MRCACSSPNLARRRRTCTSTVRAAVVLVAHTRLSSVSRVKTRSGSSQESEQLVLHVGQVHDSSGDRSLVGLEFMESPPCSTRGATFSLPRDVGGDEVASRVRSRRRADDEVVEEILAEGQLVELVVIEEQDDRSDPRLRARS